MSWNQDGSFGKQQRRIFRRRIRPVFEFTDYWDETLALEVVRTLPESFQAPLRAKLKADGRQNGQSVRYVIFKISPQVRAGVESLLQIRGFRPADICDLLMIRHRHSLLKGRLVLAPRPLVLRDNIFRLVPTLDFRHGTVKFVLTNPNIVWQRRMCFLATDW